MAKRVKKTVVAGVTREQAEQAMADFAKADATERSLTAKMDLELARIRDKYAAQLADIARDKDKAFELMQAYATERRDELFTKKKSLEWAHGTLGFRTGTPKLKTLKGFTWASVTNLCKELLPGYIRTTEELAKDRLLADRDTEEVKDMLARIGVTVAQDDTFYIDLKKEEPSDASEG